MREVSKNIAIICAGLDSIRQGYEAHNRMLFECLKSTNSINPTLVKRDGDKAKNEIVSGTISRNSATAFLLTKYTKKFLGKKYWIGHWEGLSMALWFVGWCILTRNKFHAIYTQEIAVARNVMLLKWMLPGKPQIIFAHGITMKPKDYLHLGDIIQEVNIENYDQAKPFATNEKLKLIPHFLTHIPQKMEENDKQQLKKRLGLEGKYIVLNVGIIHKEIKRTDYVVKEVATLGEEWALVVCGKIHHQEVIDLGKSLMGDRFILLYLTRKELEDIYQIADVFVFASLFEGFGIVLLEAMSHGLPIIANQRQLYKWILKDKQLCIDLEKKGILASKLDTSKNHFEEIGKHNYHTFLKYYTWDSVQSEYLELLTT